MLPFNPGSPRKAYVRLNSFLIGYLTLNAGSDKFEVIIAQMSIWKDARAIAAALFISCIYSLFVVLEQSVHNFGRHGQDVDSVYLSIGYLGVACLVAGQGAIWISTAAYREMCDMLFALVYIINERDNPAASNNVSAGSIADTRAAEIVSPS